MSSNDYDENEKEDDEYQENDNNFINSNDNIIINIDNIDNYNNAIQYDNSYINNNYNNITSVNNSCFLNNKKMKTSIDILNFKSDEYRKYQMSTKIKKILNGLEISKNIFEQLLNYSLFYSKKINKKLTTIVPIILYKLLKRNNIQSISLKDLKEKINFRYKNYLKNEKLFPEIDINRNKFNLELKNSLSKNENYCQKIYKNVVNNIKKIQNYYKINPNIIKIQKHKTLFDCKNNYNSNHSIIEKMTEKLMENDIDQMYSDPVINELNCCKKNCYNLIYGEKSDYDNEDMEAILMDIIKNKENNNFTEFFKEKIDNDIILSIAMIKYFLDFNKVIKITNQNLNEIFKCKLTKTKKYVSIIKLYLNSNSK